MPSRLSPPKGFPASRLDRRRFLGLLTLLAGAPLRRAGAQSERVSIDKLGRTIVLPLPVDGRFQNPWTPELEEGFRDRVDQAIKFHAGKPATGGTSGENEKNFYPTAMFEFLAGNRSSALRALQTEDAQKTVHAHTQGIDYYWCFTLKGQVRKYFYFGDYLDAPYRKRMYEGAKAWTEQDPFRRAHPVYGEGKPGPGYGPEVTGSWVDIRDTDNLKAMRDTSVYLMAEETGNDQTRRVYKAQLAQYVASLYHAGMREWDSENYLGHTLTAYHNLFDFAKDPEVRALAKAALDWLYTSGALNYYRGAFTGPGSRDYGDGNVVFGSLSSHPLWLYFGDTPTPDPRPDRDDAHVITSGYRPPQAVVALARRQFPLPAEIASAKPPYTLWKPGEELAPRYWQTVYYAHTYQVGSVVSAEPEKTWAVSPFKLVAFNSERGADYFVANTSPLGDNAAKNAGDQVGQLRNLVLWLRPAAADQAFYFQVPKSAITEEEGGVWFFRYEKTWLAVRPVSLASYEVDPDPPKQPRYRTERFLKAATVGTGYSGFVLEVGEQESHGAYADFKKAVREKGRLDLSGIAEGVARYTGATGDTLELRHNRESDLPKVLRNGAARDWEQETALYRPLDGDGPATLDRKTGTLEVRAGGRVFRSTVTESGDASFEEKPAPTLPSPNLGGG